MPYDKDLVKVCWMMAIFDLIGVIACVILWFLCLPAFLSLGWTALLILTVWSGLSEILNIWVLKNVYDSFYDLDSKGGE